MGTLFREKGEEEWVRVCVCEDNRVCTSTVASVHVSFFSFTVNESIGSKESTCCLLQTKPNQQHKKLVTP